jgi:hypothetical protein
MNRPTPYQEHLETWLEEGPHVAPHGLLGSVLIAIPKRRQYRGPLGLGRVLRGLTTSARVATAIAAVFLVGVLGVVALGFRSGSPFGGGGGIATAGASPSPIQTPSPTVAPTATPVPTLGPCAPADLAARITLWEGATGHRIAHVELTNLGTASCDLGAIDRPQLVDGRGAILIDGAAPAASDSLTVSPRGVLTTLVQDDNYCGPDVVTPPVTVAFVLPNEVGRFVATPLSRTDLSGVPPCLGAPGSAGIIEMQPWAP